MAGLTIVLTVLCMALLLVLSVPALYRLSFSMKEKKGYFLFSWWGKGLYLDIRYKAGEALQKTVWYGWKNRSQIRNYERWLSKEVSRETGARSQLWDDIDEGPTYEEIQEQLKIEPLSLDATGKVKEKEGEETKPKEKNEESKKSAMGIREVPWGEILRLLLQWLRSIVRHCWIRSFSISGVIGFSEPYYTGLVASVFYSSFPSHIKDIQISFEEEKIVLDCEAKGEIIPLVLLWYTAKLVMNRAIWQGIQYWRSRKDGA